jgi:hypothetical protein
MNLLSKRPRTVIGVLGSIVLTGGAVSGCSSAADSSRATAAGTLAASTTTLPSGSDATTPTPYGDAGTATGRPPDRGTPATGTAATRAAEAALAKYPGTIEGVEQRTDGSYVVHDITAGGELHVLVSKDFKVTGIEQGGPGGRGGPPPGMGPGGSGAGSGAPGQAPPAGGTTTTPPAGGTTTTPPSSGSDTSGSATSASLPGATSAVTTRAS